MALDPRSTYALSTQTADAVLSLVETRAPAQDTTATSPLPADPSRIAAAQNARAAALPGYSRSDIETGDAASANPTLPGNRADATASADANASAVERNANHRAEDAARWDAYLYSIRHVERSLVSAISFYLMCNDTHYKDFKTEHPSMDVHWINVDNKKIVSVWPRITDQWFTPR